MEYQGFDGDFNLGGTTALVTGAAQGIGKAIAVLFHRKKANVILVDIRPDVAESAKELTGGPGRCLALAGDLTKSSDVDRIVKESVRAFGRIDVLVNNAGIALLAEAEELSEEWWDRTMAVNLKAPFIMAQRVGRVMIEQRSGKIITIASQASVIGLDRHVAYCASKAGVVGMTRVLAMEWARYNITVNCVSPTVIMTDLAKKAWAGEAGEAMAKKIPAGRFGQPEEVAAAVLYLASRAADMVTGSNLMLDGGYSIQ